MSQNMSSTMNRQLSQIDNNKKENANSRPFGDILNSKSKNNIRLMFQNIRGFGYSAQDNKSALIRDFIYEKEVDSFMMAEINVNWERTSRKNTMNQIVKKWFETTKVTNSYNSHKKSVSKWLPGGTAIVTQGSLALRANSNENDERHMGRWASQCITGKNGLRTRIISVYVPQPKKDYGDKKVHQQQQEALLKLKITKPVLTAFWDDFWDTIDKWLEKGEQLIIGGDWNTNITNKKFLEPFIARNLIPSIKSRHANLPATVNRGSEPIDEIFVSSTLKITASGYLDHGQNSADHQAVWVEITKSSALGTDLPKITSFRARRLKCNNPKIVDRYNSLLKNNARDIIFTKEPTGC